MQCNLLNYNGKRKERRGDRGRKTKSKAYTSVKKNELDAQLILSIFRQPLHVLGVSRLIIRRYNRMYTAIGTCYSF